MWTDEWVGLPYAERGRGPDAFDCLGLFVTVQRVRHSRHIHDPLCTMPQAARQHIAESEKANWVRVERAQEGDALLFKVRGLALHIGYALDHARMLHTSQETGESVIEAFNASRWGNRLEGIYRYAG